MCLERSIELAFDGFRKNDWTRGPVTVHLLDLGMPEACVYTLVLERCGACAVQTCRPRNACYDPKLRGLCFHVCVKTDGAGSRELPRTYNDSCAESRSRPWPCRHGLIGTKVNFPCTVVLVVLQIGLGGLRQTLKVAL